MVSWLAATDGRDERYLVTGHEYHGIRHETPIDGDPGSGQASGSGGLFAGEVGTEIFSGHSGRRRERHWLVAEVVGEGSEEEDAEFWHGGNGGAGCLHCQLWDGPGIALIVFGLLAERFHRKPRASTPMAIWEIMAMRGVKASSRAVKIQPPKTLSLVVMP